MFKGLKRQQLATSNICIEMLSQNKGALINGEEGTGKTHIAIDVAINLYRENVLWVCKAFAKKKTEDKIKKHLEGVGEDGINFTCVSYQKFGTMDLMGFDFFVFDECQEFNNFGTKYNEKFMKNFYPKRSKRKFLALSATPLTKHTVDRIYVLKACGAFPELTPNDIKIKYFDGTKSRYGDFIDHEELVKPQEFFLEADKFVVKLTQRDMDPEFPFLDIKMETIDCEYVMPQNITEFTNSQVNLGMQKANKIISWFKDKPALVLCKYHDVAKKLMENIYNYYGEHPKDVYLCLNKRDIEKAEIELKKGRPITIITTLGLTRSSWDWNEINDVYMIETSYSWFHDRQSIMRTMRLGKKSNVKVTYFINRNEHPITKTLQTAALEYMEHTREPPAHSNFGPSSLENLIHCPGAYWLKETTASVDYAWHAFNGSRMHRKLEYYLNHPELPVPKGECSYPIQYCRQLIEKCMYFSVESKESNPAIRHDFWGTCDFWCYNDDRSLIVLDYKSGTGKKVKNNVQLWAYTSMILRRSHVPLDKIIHIICHENTHHIEDL